MKHIQVNLQNYDDNLDVDDRALSNDNQQKYLKLVAGTDDLESETTITNLDKAKDQLMLNPVINGILNDTPDNKNLLKSVAIKYQNNFNKAIQQYILFNP
ncbi:hypothetical protein ACTA71_008657 [Dictyostelium dimigraforme]